MTHTPPPGASRSPARGQAHRWLIAVSALVVCVVSATALAVAMRELGDREDGQPAASPTERATATATRAVGPDLSKRAGGLSEGAVPPPNTRPTPPSSELRENGGRRFSLPLRAHAGIEDWFGTARLYGQIHGGVDFSLAGLTEAPVYSACAGVVAAVEESPTLGLHVMVDCGGDWTFIAGFLQGASVLKGDGTGPAYEIGRGTPGGHLHVELRYQSVSIDPAGYMDLPKQALPPTPTPTPSPTPTVSPTAEATPESPTVEPQPSAPPTLTSTPTNTPTITNTPTVTNTPTWTLTPTKTPPPPKPTLTPLPVAE